MFFVQILALLPVLVVAATVFACADAAFADSPFNSDASVPNLVAPRPIFILRPVMPSNTNIDGWVEYRYAISTHGEPFDLNLGPGLNASYFGFVVRKAVLASEFDAAKLNGNAVPWYNQSRRFAFLIARGRNRIALPEFKVPADMIQSLLDRGDFAGAKTEAEKQLSSVRELPQYCVLMTLLSHAELGLGHKEAAIAALDNVTILPVKEFSASIRELLILNADAGRYRDAHSAYEILLGIQRGLAAEGARDASAITLTERSRIQNIYRAVARGESISVSGAVLGRSWSYKPVWRSVRVTDINGQVDKIIARCHLIKTTEMPATPPIAFSLPVNAGECDLEFHGASGTTFTVIEEGPDLGSDNATTTGPDVFFNPQSWDAGLPN